MKITIEFESAKNIQGGDLCYDLILKEWFIASPDEVNDLRKRTASFHKVKECSTSVSLRNFLMEVWRKEWCKDYPPQLFATPEDYKKSESAN